MFTDSCQIQKILNSYYLEFRNKVVFSKINNIQKIMIIDKIENSELYKSLHPRFDKAFEFIYKTDFSQLADGKYEIENDDIFAMVQEYNTKDKTEAKLEAHQKYIDIQYIHSGVELIGVAAFKDQVPISNDPKKDIAFYCNYLPLLSRSIFGQ